MNTLFLHPTDSSTEFGEILYQDYVNRNDVTILTGTRILNTVVKEAIATLER